MNVFIKNNFLFMKQIYENYSNEDRLVWKTLFERQMINLNKYGCKEYLLGVENVGFNANEIPNFEKTKEKFLEHTNWELHVVPGIIPVEEFFPLLNSKKFSASTWLRTMNQLDYLEEPDMFHDVFGHVPLLSIPTFSDFVLGLSKIAMRFIDDEKAMEMLGRMYWFTLEFGLIHQNNELKVYGAGICSSSGEIENAIHGKVEHRKFNVKEILNTPFKNDQIQNLYFVIESFEELFDSLEEIENELMKLKLLVNE